MKERSKLGKLNIAVITHPFNNLVGETVLANFIDVLEPLSNKIFVITGGFSYKPSKKIHIIKVKGDEERQSVAIRIPKSILTQLRICYHLIGISQNIEVIIFSLGAKAYLIPMLLAKLLRKKTIMCTTGSSLRASQEMYRQRLFGAGKFILSPLFEILERINFSLSDYIAVQSPSVINYLGLDKYRKKICIASGRYTDTNLFQMKASLKDRKNLIGYIGRLSEEKGVINFVKAIPLILKECPDIEFLIGGDGPLFNQVKYQLVGYKVGDKVKLKGWIPHHELPDYLNELKLLVLPSYTEGLPGVVREAMACGVIVIATAVGGVPDLIRDSETGFILADNSSECIARKIAQVLNYPALDQIAQNARALIEKEHTYEIAVGKYREMFSKLKLWREIR